MSGVPVICSCLRLELTVDLPLKPITIAAIPNAIRTAAAITPPSSNALRMVPSPSVAAERSSLRRPCLVQMVARFAAGAIRAVAEHPRGIPSTSVADNSLGPYGRWALVPRTTSTGLRASWSTPRDTLPSKALASAPCPREPTTIRSASIVSA